MPSPIRISPGRSVLNRAHAAILDVSLSPSAAPSVRRLAEILGASGFESDRRHRIMGFEQVAHAIFARLPPPQRRVLESYSHGVNQTIAEIWVLPFEFLMLGSGS